MFLHKGYWLEESPPTPGAPETTAHQVQGDPLAADPQVAHWPPVELMHLSSGLLAAGANCLFSAKAEVQQQSFWDWLEGLHYCIRQIQQLGKGLVHLWPL
jgi:hypothetical protein